jgi:DNA-binding NarL/FixJ family response regulator
VKNYISSIYSKLDVHDRLKAAKKAKDKGIL